MHLEIVTPDKKVYEGDVVSATVPGTKGSFQILNSHAAIISNLEAGEVVVVNDKSEQVFRIDGGLVEVKDNKIIILAEGASDR